MLLLEITFAITAGFAVWLRASFKPVEAKDESQ